MMVLNRIIVAAVASMLPTIVLACADHDGAPIIPRSSEGNVAQYFHEAYMAANTEHFNLYNMICPRLADTNAGKIATPSNARNASIDNAVAQRVFDDLYYVGEYSFWESSASAWIVDTGEGLVLIDTLYADSVQIIEEGLRSLWLDPADIKYIIIGHGHGDHYGGARYLQDKYHPRVMMAELEWEFMYAGSGSNATKPTKDLIIEDATDFTLGDTTFHFYVTPGHTPGTVSTIFNVADRGERHMVAQWGGTGFGFNGAEGAEKIGWFETYASSAKRFQDLIRQWSADVMIANHPGLDNTYAKLNAAKGAEINPWVIGVEVVANYTITAENCARAGVAAYH